MLHRLGVAHELAEPAHVVFQPVNDDVSMRFNRGCTRAS